MTEKRFININHEIWQNGEWWCSAGGEHCADVIATAMNELSTENRQLKQENEQLKQQVEDLEFKLRTIKAYDRTVKEEHSDTVYDFQKKIERW